MDLPDKPLLHQMLSLNELPITKPFIRFANDLEHWFSTLVLGVPIGVPQIVL